MSPYRVRNEQLADDALVVVRGGDLDADTIRADAIAARTLGSASTGSPCSRRRTSAALDGLARDRLAQFDMLVLMTAGAIRRAGLELRPTFRRPHFTIMLPDLDRDIASLLQCDNVRRTNPYYVPPKGGDDDRCGHRHRLERGGRHRPAVDVRRPGCHAIEDRSGAYVVAGQGTALAVAEVVDVDDDGVVHLRPLPGPVSSHEHLLSASA